MINGAGKRMGRQAPNPPKHKPKQYYRCKNCGGTSPKRLNMKCDWCGSFLIKSKEKIHNGY